MKIFRFFIVSIFLIVSYWHAECELQQDPAGLDKVRAAKKAVSSSSVDWDQVLNPLLTADVKEKLGEANAKSTLVKFLKDAAAIQYSSGADTLSVSLQTFKTDNQETVQTLFKSGFSIEQLYEFLIAAKGKIPDVISSDDLVGIASGNYVSIQDSLQTLATAALNAADVGQPILFKSRLNAIGWSIDMLVKAMNQLSATVDPDFGGQIALMKAYVRSETSGTAISINAGSTYNLNNYTISVLGYTVPDSLLNWQSSDPLKVTVNNNNKTITGVATGTATLTAFNNNVASNWIYKANVTVTSGSNGGPSPTPTPVPGTVPQSELTVTTNNGQTTDTVPTSAIQTRLDAGITLITIDVSSVTTPVNVLLPAAALDAAAGKGADLVI